MVGRGLAQDDIGGPTVGLALTDRRLIAVVKHAFSRSTVSWDHRQVTAVGEHTRMRESEMVFTVPGDQFRVKHVPKADASRFRQAVEDIIAS